MLQFEDFKVEDFPEIDIEATITVLLHRFHSGKIELPLEVHLCPHGAEAEGWRAAALKVLREAEAKKRPLIVR